MTIADHRLPRNGCIHFAISRWRDGAALVGSFAWLPVAAVLSLSLIWSPDRFVGLDLWWHFTLLAVVACCAPRNLNPIFWAMAAGLSINSAFVMAQLMGYQPVAHISGPSGLFLNSNIENTLVALVLVGLWNDWRSIFVAPWIALPLFAQPSRASLLAVVAAGGAWLWRYNRAAGIVAGAVGLGALTIQVISPSHQFDTSQRIAAWVELLQDVTVFGHGLGAYRFAYPEMEYAHNDYLQILYELGIPVFLMFVGLVLWSCRTSLVMVAFATEALFDFPLYCPATAFVAALCVGSVLRRPRL